MNAIVESINTLGYAVGGPNVASTVSAMTDTSKVYVYTGSETGYTAGNWYYYNGSAWVSGGVYQATAVETDTTLTLPGVAADAKATGDAVTELKSAISVIQIPLVAGHYIKTNGTDSAFLDVFSITDYVPFNKNSKFQLFGFKNADYASYALGYAFYDKDKAYITDSGSGNFDGDLSSEGISIPINTAYVRFSTRTQYAPNAKVYCQCYVDVHDILEDIAELQVKADENADDIADVFEEVYKGNVVDTSLATWGNDQHTRIYIKLGKTEAKHLQITSVPNSVKVAINAYSDSSYTTMVYDSGWITDFPFTIQVNANYYYLINHATSDWGAFSALTDISADVIVEYVSNIRQLISKTAILETESNNYGAILYSKTEIDLLNPYFPNQTAKTQIRVMVGKIYGEGKLIVESLPKNVQFAVTGYTTAGYVTKEYDSGWQQNTPFTVDINKDLYYLILFAKVGWGAFDSLNDIDDAVLTHFKTVKEKINNASPFMSKTVRSIAHRGDALIAPQNTAPAYILAKKEGFSIGENDVWFSEDGEFVMWHDVSLDRIGQNRNGSKGLVDINGYFMYTDSSNPPNYYWVDDGNNVYTYDATNDEYDASTVPFSNLTMCVADDYATITNTYGSKTYKGLSLGVLKRLDFGVYKGNQFKGTQIQTFAEWILLMKQLGMDAYIDRKLGMTPAIATELAEIVKKYGMKDHVSWVGVPDANLIEAIRVVDQTARICVLDHPTSELIAQYTQYNTGRGFFFNGNAASGMTEASVQLGINAGFEVEAYYVDWQSATQETIFNTIKTALSYGVSGMTLDHYRVEDVAQNMMNKYHLP